MEKKIIAVLALTLGSLAGCAMDGMSNNKPSGDAKMMTHANAHPNATCGLRLAPNLPTGEPGRLTPAAMTTHEANVDRAACAKIGINITPNLPTGEPGRLK